MNQTFNLSIEVPDGYEATGEYRTPTNGETYLTPGGVVATGPAEERYFILRRGWIPPTWLPVDNWLYNNSEQWCITNREPRQGRPNEWPRAGAGGVTISVKSLALIYGQTFISPPETSNMRVYRL